MPLPFHNGLSQKNNVELQNRDKRFTNEKLLLTQGTYKQNAKISENFTFMKENCLREAERPELSETRTIYSARKSSAHTKPLLFRLPTDDTLLKTKFDKSYLISESSLIHDCQKKDEIKGDDNSDVDTFISSDTESDYSESAVIYKVIHETETNVPSEVSCSLRKKSNSNVSSFSDSSDVSLMSTAEKILQSVRSFKINHNYGK